MTCGEITVIIEEENQKEKHAKICLYTLDARKRTRATRITYLTRVDMGIQGRAPESEGHIKTTTTATMTKMERFHLGEERLQRTEFMLVKVKWR